MIQSFPGIDNDRKNSVIFFTKEESLVYCHDVNGLIGLMGIKYIYKDWRLFIDLLNNSLRAVLLYNSNTIGYLPMSY